MNYKTINTALHFFVVVYFVVAYQLFKSYYVSDVQPKTGMLLEASVH